MKIFILKLPAKVEKAEFRNIERFLTNSRKERISKIKRNSEIIKTAFSELLIKYIIFNEFNIEPNSIEFEFNEYGKPSIINMDNFYYNVSHSCNYIICAYDSNPLGIDIEKIRDVNMDISYRFFAKNEYNYIMNSIDKRDCFFNIWTLKESYIKAVGKGMKIGLNSFSVMDDKENIEINDNYNEGRYFLKQYNMLNFYKIAVCSINNCFPEEIISVDYNKILNIIA